MYTGESALTTKPTESEIHATINMKVDEGAKDAAYWKMKFEELKSLKTSAVEDSYRALKEQTRDQIKTYKDTINFLESKLGLKASEIASTTDLLMAERKVAQKERIVDFYEKVSDEATAASNQTV